MNRRDALKLLARLPLLGFLKPEAVEAEPIRINKTPPSEELLGDSLVDLAPYFRYNGFVGDGLTIERWDGIGNHWKSTDGGQTWTQTAKAPALYIGTNTIYVGGAFVDPPISNGEYRARLDNESWSSLK